MLRAGLEPATFSFVARCSFQLSHRSIGVESHGVEPCSQNFQSCAYTKSAKIPMCGSRRIRTFGTLVEFGPLAEGWFRPLTHASILVYHKVFQPHFLIDDAKLQWRHASYLRSEKNVQKIIFFSLDLSQQQQLWSLLALLGLLSLCLKLPILPKFPNPPTINTKHYTISLLYFDDVSHRLRGGNGGSIVLN